MLRCLLRGAVGGTGEEGTTGNQARPDPGSPHWLPLFWRERDLPQPQGPHSGLLYHPKVRYSPLCFCFPFEYQFFFFTSNTLRPTINCLCRHPLPNVVDDLRPVLHRFIEARKAQQAGLGAQAMPTAGHYSVVTEHDMASSSSKTG
jgi:hypothetical protein